MLDYLILIPVYKVSDRVRDCIRSIEDNSHILIIDNSGSQECKEFEDMGIEVEYQSENIGVPRAWNIGLRRGHQWTFVVSSSMLFNKPFSHIIEMLDGYEGLMFRTTHVWHCNGISKDLVKEIGYFDENFYPGYFEDCDWDHRCSLKKINEYGNIPIDAICQVDGGATKDGVDVRIEAVHEYFKKKWGGSRTREGWGEWANPFNDKNKSISYWEEKSIETLKEEYGL
jgi:glycosyltransferase involved in cell wall biosynthesis